MKKIILLSAFLFSSVFGQINDKNFKATVGKGVHIIIFKSKWMEKKAEQAVDSVTKEVKGHEGTNIHAALSDDVKKLAKKLRIRNYPSVALYVNGSKVKVWKGDMDGILDIDSKAIKKKIEAEIAGDQF
tara:strand:+ start:569 stop:955 length:387 start_codon:yes stop_codon:yes gene_type:complete